MKKGIIFSLEALIAMTIMTSFFAFLFVFNIENVSPYKRFERVQLYAKDSLEVMSQITVKDLIDQFPNKVPTLIQEMENGNIENESTIIEAIGTLWSEGYYDASYYEAARNVSNETLSLILPKTLNYNLTAFNGQEIYSHSITTSASTEVSKSNKIVSGFQPGQPTKGFVARAWLEKINSKVFSSYLYFGGYVGQGNLTFFINDIPSGAKITSAYMEASVDSNFSLDINNGPCGLFNKTATGNFPVDSWNITDSNPPYCLEKIKAGENNKFDINFTETNITKKGIGGGYIKVTYETDQFSAGVPNTMRYNLPGIDGIINLYDSFYVPGKITNMTMNLDLSSHEKVFVNIGNKTVYYDNQSAVIDNTTLSSLLDYNFLSQRTVPFRIGHYGISPTSNLSDVVLTTSRVSDMSTCDVNSSLYADCNTTASGGQNKRIDIAKVVDKDFIDIILNNTGNRVGLVSYYSSIPNSCPIGKACWTVNVTDDITVLKNNVSLYDPASGVAQRYLCGAIQQARSMLTDPLRKNYILLMSDGTAAKSPGCIINHACPKANYAGLTDDQAAAIDEAYDAYTNHGIRVYTVGFGATADNSLLQQIAACGNGTWAASTDYDGLKQIYEKFAKEMAGSIIYDFQPVYATGVNSTLFPDSYLEFNYTPEVPAYQHGEISMKLETPPFSSGSGNGCNGSVYIPDQFSVDDIRVTSYSSKLWTQTLYVNNSGNIWTPVYNLTNFGTRYIDLGDPFNIQFSPAYLKSNETNGISLVLAKNTTEKSNECSLNNKAFYTVRFKAITENSPVLPNSTGSNVRVYFNRGDFDCNPEDSVVVTIGTPADSTIIDVDKLNTTNNAVDNAFSQLLNKLKLNGAICSGPAGNFTNPIDIEITPDLKLEISEISNVPSLWGPIKFELTISS